MDVHMYAESFSIVCLRFKFVKLAVAAKLLQHFRSFAIFKRGPFLNSEKNARKQYKLKCVNEKQKSAERI